MIISKTPYRISFFGGGSDYPEWYLENGGLVLSSTINKYIYMFSKKTKLYGWSEYKKYDCVVFFPQNKYEICDFIKNNKNIKIIPRGHGCSFGDQAICSSDLGAVIDLSKMNNIISYDEEQNIL